MTAPVATRVPGTERPAEPIGRALVVDDHDDARAVCMDVLVDCGFAVMGAETGGAALALLREHHFDVLVTDLVMPEQDGLTLMLAARAHDPHLEAIILTGHATIQTAKAAIRQGAFEYLTKPFDLDGLQQAALQAARQSQVRRRNAELGELFALAELGQSLTATLDLDTLAAQVLDAVWPLFSPTGAALFVMEGGRLELVSAREIRLPIVDGVIDPQSWVWAALQHKRPWLLPDASNPLPLADRLLGRPVSAALVPLRINAQMGPVGLLVLLRHAGRPYEQEDARRLQLLTMPIATAIENARRFRQRHAELLRRRRDMAALHKVAALAAQGLDAEQLLDEALAVIGGAVGLVSGAVALLDGRHQLLRRDGSPPDPLAEQALRRDEPLLVSERHHPIARAYAALPLRINETALGVLELWSATSHHFSLDEELLLSSMSAQLALALYNSRLLSAERDYAASIHRRNQELAAWKRVAAVVAETLDLQPMLRHALDAVLEVAAAPVGMIYLADESGLAFTVGASAGLEPAAAQRLEPVPPETATWLRTVVLSGASRLAEDLRRQSQILGDDLVADAGLRSLVAVPLEAPTQIMGVLCVATTDEMRPLGAVEAELLLAIGRQIGLAVQNAYRYEQARRDLVVKEALLREAHHRIKNNLQTISSLLVLEESYADEPAVREVLRTVRLRLRSIAAVHRSLSYGDVEEISLHSVINRIAASILSGLVGDPSSVALTVEGADVMVDSRQATTLAIIINELITNAVKYDLCRVRPATLTFATWPERSGAALQVRDSGASWPPDFDLDRDAGLGLTIVQSLVADELGGRFSLVEGRWPTVWIPLGLNKPGTGSLADSPAAALVRSRRRVGG